MRSTRIHESWVAVNRSMSSWVIDGSESTSQRVGGCVERSSGPSTWRLSPAHAVRGLQPLTARMGVSRVRNSWACWDRTGDLASEAWRRMHSC